MKLALFASGSGSNVEALIQAVKRGELRADIACIITDQPNAYVIDRAKRHDIPFVVLKPAAYTNRSEWERDVLETVRQYEIDWIILAGFMRIIGDVLLEAYPQRIINLHPSLLPAFPGRQGILDAFNAGVAQTGVTVHLVDQGIDTGPILAQESLIIEPEWQLADLEQKIHQIEHRLYPETIQKIIHL